MLSLRKKIRNSENQDKIWKNTDIVAGNAKDNILTHFILW